jgi:translation initiation factor IF-3
VSKKFLKNKQGLNRKALLLYLLAAKQNDHEAQYQLSKYYFDGDLDKNWEDDAKLFFQINNSLEKMSTTEDEYGLNRTLVQGLRFKRRKSIDIFEKMITRQLQLNKYKKKIKNLRRIRNKVIRMLLTDYYGPRKNSNKGTRNYKEWHKKCRLRESRKNKSNRRKVKQLNVDLPKLWLGSENSEDLKERKKNRNAKVYAKDGKQIRKNDEIKSESVILISGNGEHLGIYKIKKTIKEAENAGLDLVEINPKENPAVCKIIDYGKYLYELKKKEKENKRKTSRIDVKEINLTPNTSENDIIRKIENARRFLDSGHRVKLVMRYKGRQLQHVPENKDKIFDPILSHLPAILNIKKSDIMGQGRSFSIVIELSNKPNVLDIMLNDHLIQQIKLGKDEMLEEATKRTIKKASLFLSDGGHVRFIAKENKSEDIKNDISNEMFDKFLSCFPKKVKIKKGKVEVNQGQFSITIRLAKAIGNEGAIKKFIEEEKTISEQKYHKRKTNRRKRRKRMKKKIGK